MSTVMESMVHSFSYLLRDSVTRLLLASVLLLSLASVLLELVYQQPLQSEWQGKLAKLREVQQTIVGLEQKNNLDAQFDKIAPVVDELDEKLSQRFGQSELTRGINRLSLESGVEIVNINSRRDKPVEGFTITVSDISLRASYHALRKLMTSMSRLPGVNLIEGINISAGGEGKGLSVNLRLRTLGGQ